jgi:hypothetical protein
MSHLGVQRVGLPGEVAYLLEVATEARDQHGDDDDQTDARCLESRRGILEPVAAGPIAHEKRDFHRGVPEFADFCGERLDRCVPVLGRSMGDDASADGAVGIQCRLLRECWHSGGGECQKRGGERSRVLASAFMRMIFKN